MTLIAVGGLWAGAPYVTDSRWVAVTSGVDAKTGTNWTAYAKAGNWGQGTYLSIAAPGQAGSDSQLAGGGPFQQDCSGPCNASQPRGIGTRAEFGLVPDNASAVIVAKGMTVQPKPIPASWWPWFPHAKVFVYIAPSEASTDFTPYPVDAAGHRLPNFHE